MEAMADKFTFDMGGEPYSIKKVVLEVLAEFEVWRKKSIMDEAMQMAKTMPDDAREVILKEAYRASREFSVMSTDGMRFIRTARGLAKMLCIMRHPDSPEVSEVEIMRKLTLRGSKEAAEAVLKSLGVDSMDPTSPSPGANQGTEAK